MKKINKSSLILLLLILSIHITNSQDKTVIISNKVGAEIDKKENEQYNLFTYLENFYSAVFYRTDKDKYYMKVRTIDDNKSVKDTIINLSERNIFNFAYRVENAHDINRGYMPPEGKYTLDTMNNMLKVTISGIYPDLFPFVKPGKKLPLVDPSFGFGISYSYAFVDLSPVASFFRNVENYYQQQGYGVPSNNLNFSSHHMYLFYFDVALYKTLNIEIEAGKSPGDVDLWYAGMYLGYTQKFKNLRWLRPQIAAGYGGFSYHTEYSYGTIVDPQYGGVLDKIISGGGSTGFMIKAGLDIAVTSEQTSPIAFNISVSRSFFPDISNNTYGYMTKVNLSSYRFSAGLRIYL
ncbi:MAG: hypothetical protein ABSF32_08545 [Ignavibacteria bacterium]|jgi:hypothetical protein